MSSQIVQNEFLTVTDFIRNIGEHVNLTNEPPTSKHAYLVRTGGFFQWPFRVLMSNRWELRQRALAAKIMANIVFNQWEASARPASMNVARAVTTKTADKILWFLDI